MTHPKKNVSFVSQPLKPQVHGLIQIPISMVIRFRNEKSTLCIISSKKKNRFAKLPRVMGE